MGGDPPLEALLTAIVLTEKATLGLNQVGGGWLGGNHDDFFERALAIVFTFAVPT